MRIARLYGIGIITVILSITLISPEAWALNVSPASLTFTALVGGPNPPVQTVTFSKNTKRQVNWSSSDKSAWLSVTPTSGQMVGSDQILVSVNISGLIAGTYTSTVKISLTNGASVRVPVTLSISGPASTPPAPSPAPTTASLSWSANAETDVAGYKVYIGNAAGSYGAPVVLGKVTSYVAGNLQYGNTYYFAISAYDTSGNESALSTVVTKSIY
jgi:Viral BACON domain